VPLFQAVRLKRFGDRIEEPEMLHAFARINDELLPSIDALGRRRERLADPIGSNLEKRASGQIGHTVAAPTSDIRNHNIVGQVQLGLREQPPPAGTTAPSIERPNEIAAQPRRRKRMGHRRSRRGVKLAIENLSDQVIGYRKQILVRCPTLDGSRMAHDVSLHCTPRVLVSLTVGFQLTNLVPGADTRWPKASAPGVPARRHARVEQWQGRTVLECDEGWVYVDRSFPNGLDVLQYERVVRTELRMGADAILRVYPATAFPTPKDALARLTGDAEVVCEARRVARVIHHDGAPVYVYSFAYSADQVTPGRTFHGLESSLVFGNNFGAPSNHVLTQQDLAIFDVISTFWRQFMDAGDPNPRGTSVQWPPYRPGPFEEGVDPSRSDRHFVFDRRIGVANYLRDSQCNFWESFYFRSVVGAVPAAAR